MAAPEQSGTRGAAVVGERLRALLERRASGAEAAPLETFAWLLLQRAQDYVGALADEEVAALVASAFRFYAAPGDELRVRAIAPAYVTEGWDASVSVIETVMPDRPFIVDTIEAALEAEGVAPRTLLHPILAAERDLTGRLISLAPPNGGRLVTDDFRAMLARAQEAAAELDGLARSGAGAGAEASAAADFLHWLVDGGFVFLGYREYQVMTLGGTRVLLVRSGSGLGLLRRESRSAFSRPRPLAELPEPVRARLLGDRLLTITKTIAESPVHRRAHMDDVGIRQLDATGQVVGERRFIGLFTSKAYAEEAAEIPLLKRVLGQILAAEQVVPGSHDYKTIVAIFNVLPKDHLFAATPAEIRADIEAVMAAGRTGDVAVSLHPRPSGFSALVVLPRDRLSGEARQRILETLASRAGGPCLAEHLVLHEDRALLSFTFAGDGPRLTGTELGDVRAAVRDLVRGWQERLEDELRARHGEAEAERLAARYRAAFPEEYRASTPPARAAVDVALLEAALSEGSMRVALGDDGALPGTSALRLYVPGEPLVLSEFVPVLENLGLRALAEDQVAVTPHGAPRLFVQTFFVQDRQRHRLDAAAGPRLIDALLAVRAGRVASDPLGRLVLEAGLDWRAVDCLRAYAGHAVQARVGARGLVIDALARHPEPAACLFEFFAARFSGRADAAALRQRALESLDGVETLRDDVTLRALLDTVEATVRTNYFAVPVPDTLAFKIHAAGLAHLPRPRPLYEIYVHGPAVEGIHMRAGLVARGGIRHSDRPEDFRTEILGLMKTQTVKNAVIVPVGAKGGFVVRRGTPADAYRVFVGSLLDLTDNVVSGRVVPPRGLVVHDREDPYLVVAADKGTAGFSDLANAIALARGFWLGDAFASGGSHGYDHKALGVTARGAWECVRTHFRELGVDADTAPLAVAGIGDMGGDVFGNGMLRSPHLRLKAAFNHRHVFLDPDPDPAVSFAERQRLFRAGLDWDAYDPAALSPGGAVVARTAKRVVLSPEAQHLLGLPSPEASGERLVQAVLMLDADLLFNGGIGTHVKAAAETHAEVGDPANDAVRVDAEALRARVVAEGGNLGFTQRARIAFALGGGRINTDAIDNSAGVDCSDHEVNIKIALNAVMGAGKLSLPERDKLLVAMTDEVAALVLRDNYFQTQSLSVSGALAPVLLDAQERFIKSLEKAGRLNRALEFLPDDEEFAERRTAKLGLTQPERAVLLAYAKIALYDALVASNVPDDAFISTALERYFPPQLRERHKPQIHAHPLRREIIATHVTNSMINRVGSTFVHRMQEETGAPAPDVVRAYLIVREVFGLVSLWQAVEALDYKVPDRVQAAMLIDAGRLIVRSTLWFLRNRAHLADLTRSIERFRAGTERVAALLPEILPATEKAGFAASAARLQKDAVPPELAARCAAFEALFSALDIVDVAHNVQRDIEPVARLHFALAGELDFPWMRARIGALPAETHWHTLAKAALRD
ncbi:MAG: NAD-glutamate dehydrogenase, partial [Chloroflexi bacterium]